MSKALSRRSFAALLAAGVITPPAFANELPAPKDKPILTVSGHITAHNDGDVARFDRAMLEALGTAQFSTTTPWYNGAVQFEGVPMRTLLRALGASGERLIVTALNDYTTEIPISDFEQFDVLLALKRDGAYMPVRDKGPLFIVYPFDSDPDLKSQRYYGRSAWQVNRLVVL